MRLQPLARARVASFGADGAAWQEALPALLTDLERRWDLTIGSALPGGSTGYVVGATLADGTEAVLKVALRDDVGPEADVLRRADGRGYVRLLAVDLDRQALLLERLGPSLGASGRDPVEQLEVLADTLGTAWRGLRPLPGDPPLEVTDDKARGLAALISEHWARLGRPGSPAAVEQALAYADALADPDPADLDVVHGDPHPHNALRVLTPRPGGETGYCFADPDGFVADRAYDLGVAVRDWSSQLTPTTARATVEGYCQVLADRTGVDAERIWRWGFVERVSTGLYVLGFGAERVARPFLDTAAWLV